MLGDRYDAEDLEGRDLNYKSVNEEVNSWVQEVTLWFEGSCKE